MKRTENFSGNPNPECDNGDTFENCNFLQAVADTLICAGKTGLTFRNCNLINCVLPPDATREAGNICRKELCSHLHPGLGLAPCADECDHYIGSDIDENGDVDRQYEDIPL